MAILAKQGIPTEHYQLNAEEKTFVNVAESEKSELKSLLTTSENNSIDNVDMMDNPKVRQLALSVPNE